MEHKLATAERKVLVQLVKMVQQRGLEGEKGGWKEFLNSHDKKIGSSLSDPSRRANDVLIAFLTTFKQKEHLQLFARVLQLDSNRDLIEKFKEESPDKETPEQRLVRLTIAHHDYPTDYSFPSFAEDWFVSEMGKKKSKLMKSTRMVAIDCEMVGCEDGRDAVVRVAAVDRDLNVILDKFVKPDRPVVDYRTHITGVTAEDLERATLSVADIQKKLRRFLSKGTILVGHSLDKDLTVLKIDHARVIDTSMVFKFSNATNFRRPSLNYLCKLVLGHEVREEKVAHNCVHDAAGAMKLVLAVVEKGVDTSVPLSEELLEAEKKRLEADKCKLFIHKIPHYVRSQELEEVISGKFTVDVKPPKLPGGFFSAVFVFDSPEEANQAFENVDGNLAKDKSGLSQKMFNFNPRSGAEATIYVRKMVQDGEISATTRARTDVNNDSEETREANPNHGIEEMLESEKTRLENEKTKLLLHKIPHSVSSQEIKGVVTGDFTLDIMPPKRGHYSAVAIFNSPEEANEAFENVDGELTTDRMGLPQKLAGFKLSSGLEATLYIRKMVKDDGNTATKRAHTEENNVSSKRQKRENVAEEIKEANVNHGIQELESEKTSLENEKTKLLLHNIPHSVSSQEIKGVVTGDFTLDIMPPKRGHYSAVAIFNSPEEANQAFENVDGELAKDRMGLPQKLATFKLSSGSVATLYVRKMVQDGGNSATKRAHTEENSPSTKRQKREDDSEETKVANGNHRSVESLNEYHLKKIEKLKQKEAKNSVKSTKGHSKKTEELKTKLEVKDSVESSEDHLKEIEQLKQKLKAKETEIQAQDKIIANLKQKLERKSR